MCVCENVIRRPFSIPRIITLTPFSATFTAEFRVPKIPLERLSDSYASAGIRPDHTVTSVQQAPFIRLIVPCQGLIERIRSHRTIVRFRLQTGSPFWIIQ